MAAARQPHGSRTAAASTAILVVRACSQSPAQRVAAFVAASRQYRHVFPPFTGRSASTRGLHTLPWHHRTFSPYFREEPGSPVTLVVRVALLLSAHLSEGAAQFRRQ